MLEAPLYARRFLVLSLTGLVIALVQTLPGSYTLVSLSLRLKVFVGPVTRVKKKKKGVPSKVVGLRRTAGQS